MEWREVMDGLEWLESDSVAAITTRLGPAARPSPARSAVREQLAVQAVMAVTGSSELCRWLAGCRRSALASVPRRARPCDYWRPRSETETASACLFLTGPPPPPPLPTSSERLLSYG